MWRGMSSIINEDSIMSEDAIIALALEILQARLRHPGEVVDSPASARHYLQLTHGTQPYESFVCVMLDTQLRVIEFNEMFRGTIDQTSVYPREVVKAALAANAAAVILSHNHPSGVAEPSMADRQLTKTIKDALGTVNIPVLDHIIVAGASTMSFSDRGIL